MTDVNIPLLRKAVEWAEAEAAKPWVESRWTQNYFIAPGGMDERGEPVTPSSAEIQAGWVSGMGMEKATDCGTCYCIAGYVAFEIEGEVPDRGGWEADDIAAEALGLDYSATQRLFHHDNTIADVRRIAEEIAGESL